MSKFQLTNILIFFVGLGLLFLNLYRDKINEKSDFNQSIFYLVEIDKNGEKLLGTCFIFNNKIITSTDTLLYSKYNNLNVKRNLYIENNISKKQKVKIQKIDLDTGVACLVKTGEIITGYANLVSSDKDLEIGEMIHIVDIGNEYEPNEIQGKVITIKSNKNINENIDLIESNLRINHIFLGAPVFNNKDELIGFIICKSNNDDFLIMPTKKLNDCLKGKFSRITRL